jgi:hypothetical protein
MDNFLTDYPGQLEIAILKRKRFKKKINQVIDCTKSLVGFQIVLKQYVDQLDCI